MSQPEPTHGWAYPVQQSKSAATTAHFYQQLTPNRGSLCGRYQYRGQQAHTKLLRGVREMCPTCHHRGQKMGFFK